MKRALFGSILIHSLFQLSLLMGSVAVKADVPKARSAGADEVAIVDHADAPQTRSLQGGVRRCQV
jgi:hypothetical protein